MASENQIKHKIVISGEQEYKRAMRDMSAQLKEAKSEVKATSAEMEAQGKTLEGLSAQMKALENQRQRESDILNEMRRHLEEVVNATGAESEEAVRLRTRINAMRTEIAQTNGQISALTGELSEARDAAEGMGGSGAADGIRSLGDAAQGAEGDLDGILGKLGALGQGFTIGIGASIGANVLSGVTKAISDAVVLGWNEAIESRIEYNQLGVKTGTAGTEKNTYMSGVLNRLKLGNPNRDASELIAAIAAAYTQFDETTFNNGDRLNGILTTLNAVSSGVGTSMESAVTWIGQMQDVFGENPEDLSSVYYFLGTSQAGNDGLTVMQQYATSWKDIGLNAVGAAGALVLARIAGVDNLSAVGKSAQEAQQFILENKKGLKKLGIEAEDLPKKFKKGGEEAKEAMRLLLESFLNASPDTQAELGPQIFGQEGWERYGTRIAKALVGGYETTLTEDMKDATKRATAAVTNDFNSQSARLWELVKQSLGDVFDDPSDVLTAGLRQGVDLAAAEREGGAQGFDWLGAFIGGFANGAGEALHENAVAQMTEQYGEDWKDKLLHPFEHLFDNSTDAQRAAEEKGQETTNAILEAYYAGAAKRNSALPPDMPAGQATEVDDFLDALLGTGGADAVAPEVAEAAEKKGEEAADAVMDAYASGFARNPRMRNLDEMELPPIGSAAPGAVDDFLDRLLGTGGADAIAEAAEEAGKETGGAALDAWTQGAAEGMDYATVKANVENLNAQIAAALGAGDSDLAAELTEKRNALIPVMMQLAADVTKTGEDAKSGFDGTFSGVTVTVEDTVTGALTVLDGHVSDFYNRGWNAGDAFVRGYKDAQGIESPSKVMAEAAGYTMEGLFQGLDRGNPELIAKAEGISSILAGGAMGAASGAVTGGYGNGGIGMDDLEDVLDRFANKINLAIDGEVAGGLLEKSVSDAAARRISSTLKGRANAIRGW